MNWNKLKGLDNQNLRDHMNEAELIFTTLAALSIRKIADHMQADGFEENKIPAQKGGQIAKKCEERTRA
jgi:DNA-damage-inducible protein D